MLNKNIILKGKKTIIRPFLESDINSDYISWLNDIETMQYSNQRFLKHDKKSSLSYFMSFINSPNFFFAIEDRQTNKVIGTMTVYFFPREQIADVGILIGDKKSSGKGFGKDSWCTLIKWLTQQTNIRKITAGTVSVNKAMISLMKAAKMTEDGCRSKHQIIKGNAVDVIYYAIFNEV